MAGVKMKEEKSGEVKCGFISSYLLPLLFLAHSFNPIPSCMWGDFGGGSGGDMSQEELCPQTYCNSPQYIKVALVNIFQKDSIEYGIIAPDCFSIKKEKIILCIGGGTFPHFYVQLFGEELSPDLRRAISNFIFVNVPAVHFYDIDRNKLWMKKIGITPISCAYVEDKDKIYCFGESKFVYDEKSSSFSPFYLQAILPNIYEYDYKTGNLRKMRAKLPTFEDLKKNFRKFGYCDQDKDPESFFCICDKENYVYSVPCLSISPGSCIYVKRRRKIYCIGSAYNPGDFVADLDLIFEYDPFEDKFKALDIRIKRTRVNEIIPEFSGAVHFPDIGKIIGAEGICDVPEYMDGQEGLTEDELCNRFFQSFPFFDYERMETGFLNWRFPKFEKTGFSTFFYSNCVYSSLKKSIFCIGGEDMDLDELDSVV